MCLISALGKGIIKYDDKVIAFIKQGASSNRHGSGFMYKRNGTAVISISKGYFDVDNMLKAIEALNLGLDDELVIHHRISTAGLISGPNTHPFVISDKHKECCATEITTSKPCLAHNGVFNRISYYENLDKDFSDTYAFARYIMSSKQIMKILEEDEQLFETLTSSIIGSSKIAILHPNKDMQLIGNFVQDEGYQHSNSGYKTYVYDRGGSSTKNTGYPRYNKHRDWDHYGWGEGYDREINYDDNDTEGTCFIDLKAETLRKSREAKTGQEETNKRLLQAAVASKTNETNSTVGKLIDLIPKDLRFDGTIITIDKHNFNHFNYLSKDEFDKRIILANFQFAILDEFVEDTLMQQMKYVVKTSTGTSTHYDAVTTDSIQSNYYFYPKLAYVKTYKDFVKLTEEITNPGTKQCVKKLSNLLGHNIHKDNDYEILYSRTNKRYTKRALLLFYEIAKKEFEYNQSKGIIEVNQLAILL